MRKSVTLTSFNFLILLLFFLVIEWRWQVELLGYAVPTPYYLVAMLCLLTSVASIIKFTAFNGRLSILGMAILGFIVYCFAVFVVNIPELMKIDMQYVMVECGVWAINFGLFFIALDETLWTALNEHRRMVGFLYILFTAVPIFVIIILGNAADANYSLRRLVYLLDLSSGGDNHGVSYQSYGDKIALLTFLALLLCKSRVQKICVFCLTLVSLYIVGSKASLLGFMFASAVYFLVKIYKNKGILKFIASLAVILVMLLYSAFHVVGNEAYQDSENWILQSFAAGGEEESVESRSDILKMNMETLRSRFLLGDYAFDLKMGRPGSATHNVLLFLDYYGIFGFAFFVSLWCYLLFLLIRYRGPKILVVDYSILSLLFYGILVIVARGGSGYLTYWTLGAAAAAVKFMRDGRKRSLAAEDPGGVRPTHLTRWLDPKDPGDPWRGQTYTFDKMA